ncbi:hypothetical protein EON65_10605 [archaeon]|nr:MAG: hypothetical protein EON65_10605 [archaeon]
MKGKDQYTSRQGKLHHAAYGHGGKGSGGSGSAQGKQPEEINPKFPKPQVHSNFPSFAFDLSVLLVIMAFHIAQLFALYGQVSCMPFVLHDLIYIFGTLNCMCRLILQSITRQFLSSSFVAAANL